MGFWKKNEKTERGQNEPLDISDKFNIQFNSLLSIQFNSIISKLAGWN